MKVLYRCTIKNHDSCMLHALPCHHHLAVCVVKELAMYQTVNTTFDIMTDGMHHTSCSSAMALFMMQMWLLLTLYQAHWSYLLPIHTTWRRNCCASSYTIDLNYPSEQSHITHLTTTHWRLMSITLAGYILCLSLGSALNHTSSIIIYLTLTFNLHTVSSPR